MGWERNLDRETAGLGTRVGGRVWLIAAGRSGRVVAHAQGGLLCRVRLDGPVADAATVVCAGGDLLPLLEAEPRGTP